MTARSGDWYIEQGRIDLTTCPYSKWAGREGFCKWCDKKLPRNWRTVWCGKDCEKGFNLQHEFASTRVIVRDASRGECQCKPAVFEKRLLDAETGILVSGEPMVAHTVCQECQKCAEQLGNPLEVNHIIPRIGNKDPYSCLHHTDNLEVLCHFHHRRATEEQMIQYPEMRSQEPKQKPVKSSYKVRARMAH